MYLYAITDKPESPLPSETGLEGAGLLSLCCRGIAAVVSPVAAAETPVTEDNVLRHEAVVEALMTDRTVLPARFGAVAVDETTLKDALQANHAEFAADLGRVRDHVELGLRVLWDGDAWPARGDQPANSQGPGGAGCCACGPSNRAAHTASGRAYLLDRLEQERRAQAERQRAHARASQLHTQLSCLATDSTLWLPVTGRGLLTAAYLVRREQIDPFQREVQRLGSAYPTLHLVCTGPWPPYSFVWAGLWLTNEPEGGDGDARPD